MSSEVLLNDPILSATEDEGAVSDSPTKKSKGKKKGKGKSKKGKKGKATKIPKDMVLNERGELVTAREYALEKT